MSNFQKTVRIMENPTLPTIWLMPLNAPQCPRIPGIGAGNRPSDLGFQESELDGTHDGIGFQESRQERIIVWSDFRNPSRKRTRFGWISRI
jgi:hypothetical protein